MLGLCSGELRLPLTDMSPANRQALEQALRTWGFPQLLATAAD
jgi:dihydrodipicolinate synthase/N-acetylneuraminate lyase